MSIEKNSTELFPEMSNASVMEQLDGVLDHITFHNDQTGYTVGKLTPHYASDSATIVGTFINPIVGESLNCRGVWKNHPQFGRQFQVHDHHSVKPATASAIEKYLGSGLLKGVGPVMARKIVQKFGVATLDILDETPNELLKVPGMGQSKLDLIQEAWSQQREVRAIMLFLQSHGVTPAFAARVYRTYGDRSIEIVENNPYQLANDVWGVGFRTADKMALNMGVDRHDTRRVEAAVLFVLDQQIESNGHCYLTEDELVQNSVELLGECAVVPSINSLVERGSLIREESQVANETVTAIYPRALYAQERSLAGWMRDVIAQPLKTRLDDAKFNDWLDAVLETKKIQLSSSQKRAVSISVQNRISVLTGGPGVGKTTTTNAIVAAFEALKRRVVLASPTGRAAKRLSEVTGREAKTVHRLLEYDPVTHLFRRNPESPLDCDVVIIDEASMLDVSMTNILMHAIPPQAQIIFVGDVDQLPSVGPGTVLQDLIESEIVPVSRLTEVFRQAAESLIVRNAHAVHSGNMPELPKASEMKDCVFVPAEDGEELANKVVAIVARSLPARGFSTSDIQVLTPMQRGSAGSIYLNERLQEALNPKIDGVLEITRGKRLFRARDRVMQTSNNYDKNVFNGDIGIIKAIETDLSGLTVGFADCEIKYAVHELDQVNLAYACTIHKAQGSEYPAVVLAVHTQHFVMLQRNLVYTGLTRARKIAVILGSKRAISMAVSRQDSRSRHTRLRQRLRGEV